ncbi:MAG: archaetidylserine decarboxylase [Pseudohongiellaceae bacterium]|nr:archaetidylserine decarboxylase [Pseudohongiellaceae bacterium]
MKGRLFLLLQHIVPHHALSRVVGKIAQCRWRPVKNAFINWFIKRYKVDMGEALYSNSSDFEHFNAFFTRELKPGARPIEGEENTIACPADGAISQMGRISAGKLLQAKGKNFSLQQLLGGNPLDAEAFQEGSFATIYLSPKDYHRVHMPLAGTLTKMVHVPGKLFSVNQLTSENVDGLFARNERAVCFFDTDFGPMAVVLVGAMIVASIDTVWAGQVSPGRSGLRHTDYRNHVPNIQIPRGEEVGRFKLGSTAIIVFGPGMAELHQSLSPGQGVRMGQSLGQARS